MKPFCNRFPVDPLQKERIFLRGYTVLCLPNMNINMRVDEAVLLLHGNAGAPADSQRLRSLCTGSKTVHEACERKHSFTTFFPINNIS